MVNPYVLIATHDRVEITCKNIDCILRCNVGVILVVSDAKEYAIYKKKFPQIAITKFGNYPLGKKWQIGVQLARQLKADPLIINGSDDILSPDFYNVVDDYLLMDYQFIGLKSWYIYDLKKVYHLEYTARLPLGGGRVYTRALLSKMQYNLFDCGKNKHLDDKGWNNVVITRAKQKIITEPLILSVKGDWQVMNPAEKIITSRNAKLIATFTPENILPKFNLCVESVGR